MEIDGIELIPVLAVRSLPIVDPRCALGKLDRPGGGYAFLTDRPTAIILRSWSFATRW